jgi:hypothetical protein
MQDFDDDPDRCIARTIAYAEEMERARVMVPGACLATWPVGEEAGAALPSPTPLLASTRGG